MHSSIVIVTRSRPDELEITLNKLLDILDLKQHEILVFIDGCKQTQELITKYDWVHWTFNEESIGASPARSILYKKAKGDTLIGLDDDAHPISENFIAQIANTFQQNPNVGIIAFQEIKGIYDTDAEALKTRENQILQHQTTDFIGCGFAIKKEVYDKTRGFPVWIDIYNEEPCVSIEVIDLSFEIFYNNEIIVNHRVDRKQRLVQHRNYFRFEKQLKNSIYYYLVYYPKPTFKIIKLLVHNFRKYALEDKKYFLLFFKSTFAAVKNARYILKFRKPVSNVTIQKMVYLKSKKY